jgi:hypothetical protein
MTPTTEGGNGLAAALGVTLEDRTAVPTICDICGRRESMFTVPVFSSAGGYRRNLTATEHWCAPCHVAVLAKYPTETMWPPFGVWLRPEEVPA